MSKKINNSELNRKLCGRCSICCRYVTVEIDKPKTKENIDEIRWYLLHGVNVCLDGDGEWMVYLPLKCKALSKKGKCNIYPKRPIVCQKYTQNECDRYDQKSSKEIIFKDEKKFLKYVKKNKNY